MPIFLWKWQKTLDFLLLFSSLNVEKSWNKNNVQYSFVVKHVLWCSHCKIQPLCSISSTLRSTNRCYSVSQRGSHRANNVKLYVLVSCTYIQYIYVCRIYEIWSEYRPRLQYPIGAGYIHNTFSTLITETQPCTSYPLILRLQFLSPLHMSCLSYLCLFSCYTHTLIFSYYSAVVSSRRFCTDFLTKITQTGSCLCKIAFFKIWNKVESNSFG
jgi:hypothetical protein